MQRVKATLPVFSHRVAAGFPSPADDYLDEGLVLEQQLIPHPSSTYLVYAEGHSMRGAGIFDGDLLIVDRSLSVRQGSIIIAAIDGELTCKYLDLEQSRLLPANKHYPAIPLTQELELVVEGVVTHSIRKHLT